MYLPELRFPFNEALAKAKEIRAEYVWFNHLSDEIPISQMSDEEVDHLISSIFIRLVSRLKIRSRVLSSLLSTPISRIPDDMLMVNSICCFWEKGNSTASLT